MFGKKIEDLGNIAQVKSSIVRGIKTNIVEQSPESEGCIENIISKKSNITQVKVKSGINMKLICCDNEVVFFENDKQIAPTLRLLHKYPCLLPRMQIDQGGIKFIMNGANVMAPGLTSPGGQMVDVKEGTIVGIYGEGKQHAIAIGITTMSTEQIKTVNKDTAIEIWHLLGDGLWNLREVKK